VWKERKPTRCNYQKFIINFCLNMFRASLYPSSGQQRPCVTACGVLPWFCWMWLVAVVGRCVVECEHMLRQKLIINIWLLHIFCFLSLHTLVKMHGHGKLNNLNLRKRLPRGKWLISRKYLITCSVHMGHLWLTQQRQFNFWSSGNRSCVG